MDENGHRTPALVKGLATVELDFSAGSRSRIVHAHGNASISARRSIQKRRTAEVPRGHRAIAGLPGNHVEVMADGAEFYRSMVDAIGRERTINLEAFVMNPGSVADSSIDALVGRARAGVQVNIVLDAFGAKKMFGRPLRRLMHGGCHVNFYQRATWYSLGRINNRTHRELLIVDGTTAFTGGPGIADYWAKEAGANWRGATRHSHRRPRGRGAPGRLRGELARIVVRNHRRARLLSTSRCRRLDCRSRVQELAGGSIDRVPHAVPLADRVRTGNDSDQHAVTSYRPAIAR